MTGITCPYCGGQIEVNEYWNRVCDCCYLIITWADRLDTSNMEPEMAEEAKQLLKDKYRI